MENISKSYYAGYNGDYSEVAVFKSRKKRDEWLKGYSLFNRIPLTKKKAFEIVGNSFKTCVDEMDKDIIWMCV